jgi:hypothetical protein
MPGKTSRKIARKPGDFGIRGFVKAVHFFHASRKSLRKAVFTKITVLPVSFSDAFIGSDDSIWKQGVFMFSNKTLRPGSLSRIAHSAFALFVMFCLSAALFTSCSTGGDSDLGDELDTNLIGTWTSEYSDGYTITEDHLSYGYGAEYIEYAGTIKYVSNFTSTAGVIIIEYDANHKPIYYAGYDPDTYEPIGDPLPLKGNFVGVYYKSLKPGESVQMGTAYGDGGAEVASLNAAIAAFTMGNEGTYMTYYGTYTKQP